MSIDGLAAQSSKLKQQSVVLPIEAVGLFVASLDFSIIVLLSVVNGVAYHQLVLQQAHSTGLFIGSGLVVAALFVSLLHANGLYGVYGTKKRLRTVAFIWTMVFLFLTAVAFILKVSDDFSRGSVLSFFVVGFAALVSMRVITSKALQHAHAAGALIGRRVALVTEHSELTGSDLINSLQSHGWHVQHLLLLPDSSDAPAKWLELVSVLRQARADEIVLAVDWTYPDRVTEIMKLLRMLPLPVRLVPDRATRKLLEGRTISIGALLAVELQRAPLGWAEQTAKRCLDVAASACGLLALLPLFAAVAVAVRLDSPGPIFFRQKRMGFNGRPFRIFKFRSMNVLEDGPIIQQARRNDPRVTYVGQWLRRTSVDELPQLLNVLVGDMSLVGPRPHAIAHDNEFDRIIADYALRYHVKPGITGWAQVNGLRGETPTVNLMTRRVDHDLWYIRNWSLFLDIKIIMKTIAVQMRSQDVY